MINHLKTIDVDCCRLIKTLAAVAAGTVLATSAFAHDSTAMAIRGASPYVAMKGWLSASSGPSTEWKTCISRRYSAQGRSRHLHASGICT
jgi:hypothetical protein